MKVLSLNAWGGHEFRPLIEFLRDPKNRADIYCFQEIFHTDSNVKESSGARANLLEELQIILPDHRPFYAPQMRGHDNAKPVDFHLEHGLASFVRKDVAIEDIKEEFLVGYKFEKMKDDLSNLPANLLCLRLNLSGKKVNILNIHGFWYPGSKLDTPERVQQSGRLINFLKRLEGEVIICGDFNLLPKTKSIKVIEEFGLRNLIKEFGVKDTRGPVNEENYKGKEYPLQRFADFTFVSEGVEVKEFKVPWVAISDHLPMMLEFDLK